MTYSVLLPGMFAPGDQIAALAYRFHRADTVIADQYWGLGSLEDTYARTCDRLEPIVERHGRVRLKAHSLGGRIGTWVGLKRPDLVERVDAISSPFDGIDIVPQCLLRLAAVVPGVRDLICDRDRIADFQRQVELEWDPTVSLRLVAVSGDLIVNPRRSAWALNPPAGCDVAKYWVGPLRPRRLPEDVTYIRALANVGHLTGIFNGRLSAFN